MKPSYMSGKVSFLDIILCLVLVTSSLLIGIWSLGVIHADLTLPFVYNSGDATWQLTLTKMLKDTGWILTNPFLGAPDVAHWHQNSAAQTSALHSVFMLGLGYFLDDAVEVQQVYYILNFPLIALSSYAACRILKINALPAAAVGLIFAFASFRYSYIIYSFLPNYAALPLGLIPVIWVGLGEFARKPTAEGTASEASNGVKSCFPWGKFFWGLAFVSLISMSDGYYAFFTLLLLGFVTAARVFSGDLYKPQSIAAALAFIVCLISVSFLVSFPLYAYKASHIHEFYPDGAIDPALVKQPFEAEVYSSSLKLMLAPIPEHRISLLGDLGIHLVETSEAARLFKLGPHSIPLGTIGALLLLFAFCYLLFPALRSASSGTGVMQTAASDKLINILISLILFGFLCSITGGIGALVALVFPTIRAYDRFPLVLLFLLLLFGARLLTLLQNRSTRIPKWVFSLVLMLIVACALFDQIPKNSDKSALEGRQGFLADRNFVTNLETKLPAESMVYQYPYADYLIANNYYEWGSFASVRLYLHSKTLRWSNGAAKNSYVENWHLRIAKLPTDQMLDELGAVGFAGMVIDRTVVSDPEYNEIEKTLSSRGLTMENDPESHLAFARFGDSGFRLEYEPNYVEAARLIVTNPARIDYARLPSIINATALQQSLAAVKPGSKPFVVEKSNYPAVFLSGAALSKGWGSSAISPDDMKGTLTCSLNGGSTALDTGAVTLNLTNQSDFDWFLRTGNYPVGIGFHVNDAHDAPIRFDNGTRLSLASGATVRDTSVVVRHGQSMQFSVPTSGLDLETFRHSGSASRLEFGVVQDGNAWFANLRCQVPLDQ